MESHNNDHVENEGDFAYFVRNTKDHCQYAFLLAAGGLRVTEKSVNFIRRAATTSGV